MELILLRPLWLLALIPWLWQGWRRHRQRPLLAPAMGAYLLPSAHIERPWPWLAGLPLILALSGPAIESQSRPIAAPPLDIWLLDLSRSMLAQDLKPDRATRARLLLQQLLAGANGERVALILFAADAYLAMPPTRDHQAISQLLPDLRPAIMPQQGSAPERAIALALSQIPAGQSARLLLITDDLSPVQQEQIAALWPCQQALFCHSEIHPRLDILLINKGGATAMPPIPPDERGWIANAPRQLPVPDRTQLAALANRLGGSLQGMESTPPYFAPLPSNTDGAQPQPRDLGPWLLLPLLPLALLARSGALWLLLLTVSAGLLPSPYAHASATPQDQQAWHYYQQGHFQQAARTFEDPIWQGNAWYRAGDYARAIAAYQRSDTATAHYNRGNALVQRGELAAAEQAYLAALAREPSHADARYNLALLRAEAEPSASPSPAAPDHTALPQDGVANVPQPPSASVILLQQRLHKEALRRELIKVAEPW